MNDVIGIHDKLRQAMANADIDEIDAVAEEIGRTAVHAALAGADKPDQEAQRIRDLDGALADVVEIVARQRLRLGRRACSRHDGETIRRMFELLRAMQPENGTDALR